MSFPNKGFEEKKCANRGHFSTNPPPMETLPSLISQNGIDPPFQLFFDSPDTHTFFMCVFFVCFDFVFKRYDSRCLQVTLTTTLFSVPHAHFSHRPSFPHHFFLLEMRFFLFFFNSLSSRRFMSASY